MNQQPLSGFEIQELAKRIGLAIKTSDASVETMIQAILSQYILLPKYQQPKP